MNTDVILTSSYNHFLVVLSLLIAMSASYVALDLAGRTTAARGRARAVWLGGGATAMGIGIWSMHYIGMLAFTLSVPVFYALPTVLVSLLAAIFASAVALFVVSGEKMSPLRALAGSIAMGAGIGGMHYIGMAAMRLQAMCHWSLPIVALSIVIAIVVSLVALWLAFHFRGEGGGANWLKAGSAVVMGVAVAAMHYTAMAAATYTASDAPVDLSHAINISTLGIAGITLVTFMALGLAVITSLVDRRFSAQTAALESSEERHRLLFATMPQPVWVYDQQTLSFLEVNQAAIARYGYPRDEFLNMKIADLLPFPEREGHQQDFGHPGEAQVPTGEAKHLTKDNRLIDVEIYSHPIQLGGREAVLVVAHDVTERKRLEVDLRQSQKLEAVGSLAAGIAHEINTPIQFVGDNTRFLRDAFGDLEKLIGSYEKLHLAAVGGSVENAVLQAVGRAQTETDWKYLGSEIPKALEETLDGVDRVARIVRAMKEFSHVDRSGEKVAADLNRALESTLVVARSELKYVADVVTEFGDLPPVVCYLGDMNQVFLNLLINAAHAIEDVVKGTGTKGTIRVKTLQEGGEVVVSVSDTGTGIPRQIQDSVFDPFFTTKEVGRGTGQGLALARVVVQRHGGSLTFKTRAGEGTTFFVRLPINPPHLLGEERQHDSHSLC